MNQCPLHFLPPKDGETPQNVRILDLSVNLLDDHKRIQINIHLTSFLTPPDLILSVKDDKQNEVASMILIENPSTTISHFLHLKSSIQLDECTLEVQVSYGDFGIVDQRTIALR